MARAGGLALGAVLAGLLLTLGLVASLDPPVPRAAAPRPSEAAASPGLEGMLRRCRTVTSADAACEAAWEAKRRRFFGKKD